MAEFLDALKDTVQATWPEVGENVFLLQQLARRNWENLINREEISYPFAVIHVKSTSPYDGAMDSVESLAVVEFGYAVSSDDAAASGNVTNYVYSRLGALRDALVDYTGDGFQLMENRPSRDVGFQNALNSVFLQLQSKAQGGILTAELRCED